MDIPARTSVLQRVPFFGGLEEDQLATVAREAHERPLKKDETLFQQGEEATHGYVLGWGRLRLDQTTPDGQNVVLRYMGPGDLVGTVAVLRRIPFPATPVALEDGLALSWSAPRLAELMERFPKIALNAIGVIGGRIEELQARLQAIATQRVERRIASTLLRLANQSGRRTEAGVEIPFPVSRQDLAEMTATTLHTVSRTLSAWDQQGIVESRRSSHLVIRHPHRLVEIAEQG
ncbi:cAMP-binding domain of CRP or a regulatory subunit of cAMP-dependent protein kinases [Tistlia consotensis]|uniref:cAMP-binding domain of CRP or a regulatory subunit of cAMP-dependent protein kinases n=1 Tax=Tistlia consotensis USBA 355 TaxID=560819 RepID=A0A1Y6CHN7_9PROT|nr:Crp/Fnr family transcriptional regulator [Tistlia consotensis]SMF56468.1 cAMP-binding domain of CRP or a regulatory subunit of cAMP-dependent protein kinases [Tistlia consotensis USBA 355]SNR44630.1 cAMP-binding domain of CRP or a regulatory subunit of cAMP-dependent protein kinases [Tistlia consotensis]